MKTGWVLIYGVMCGLLVGGIIYLVSRPARGAAIELKALPTDAPIQVHVSGQVLQPGVISLPQGSRVQDALTLAGGLTAQADPQALNLARRLSDGEKIYVPALGEEPALGAESGAGESRSGSGLLVDINTATQEQLESLPGIGPATAQAIIQYRTEHGPFQAMSELDAVPGIGEATLESLQGLVTVNP